MLSESTRSREGKCEASHRGKGSAKGTGAFFCEKKTLDVLGVFSVLTTKHAVG
jgi:hypothetical protein